ncbi:MAG: RNA polymerase sigma factor [bacterium]
MTDEDAELLDAWGRGERKALESLVKKYQKEVFSLCYRMVRQREDAEELAQQAFCNALGALPGFKRRAKFRTWLYRIAVNLCRSHISTRKTAVELNPERTAAPEDAEGAPVSRLLRSELAREAAEHLARLPEKQRLVVTLRVFHEMDYGGIGRIAGCSARTAKVHFHYGVENLRKRMKKNEVRDGEKARG